MRVTELHFFDPYNPYNQCYIGITNMSKDEIEEAIHYQKTFEHRTLSGIITSETRVTPSGNIKGKIRDVPDEICKGCRQLWNGECRAFLVPQSKEEREHRMKDPLILVEEAHMKIIQRSRKC